MATAAATVVKSETPTSRPYLALGLTFLLLGLGFAFPLPLAPRPPAHMWEGNISPQTLNLYALTVFTGWAHFVYAWRGQWRASYRFPTLRRASYWGCLALVLAGLFGLRLWMGLPVFSLLTWVYNISHFVKAEIVFTGRRETKVAFYSPVLAFAWFTLSLFAVGPLRQPLWVVSGSVLLAALVLSFGGWRLLAGGEVRLPLLTLFLFGEAMVWSAYEPSDAFRVGVYVVHIAAASFYHYLTSYFYAESSGAARRDRMLKPLAIVAVNVAIVAAGVLVAWVNALQPLNVILGLGWFTVWVAFHLVASDLMPLWKPRRAS